VCETLYLGTNTRYCNFNLGTNFNYICPGCANGIIGYENFFATPKTTRSEISFIPGYAVSYPAMKLSTSVKNLETSRHLCNVLVPVRCQPDPGLLVYESVVDEFDFFE
jgi:hypothetical protein